MKLDTVLWVGLGGTGSNGIESAVRLLTYHPNGTKKIIIVDLDHYEEKNAQRQFFHSDQIGKNKAVATCDRLSGFPNLIAEDIRVDRNSLQSLIADYHSDPAKTFVFIAAVDNDKTREEVLKTLDETLPNYVFINPGNGTEVVDCSIHIVRNGQPLTLHPFDLYENIREPKDKLPGSCGEEAISAPQTITANMLAATGVIMYLTALLNDWDIPIHLAGNVKKMKLVPSASVIKLS